MKCINIHWANREHPENSKWMHGSTFLFFSVRTYYFLGKKKEGVGLNRKSKCSPALFIPWYGFPLWPCVQNASVKFEYHSVVPEECCVSCVWGIHYKTSPLLRISHVCVKLTTYGLIKEDLSLLAINSTFIPPDGQIETITTLMTSFFL